MPEHASGVTPELVLHSFRRCPFAIRVRMVLEEKGLPSRTIEEDLSHPSEALLRMNPSGQVPVLIHRLGSRDEVIAESAIINEYLEETFPIPSLLGRSPRERAKMRLLTHWCASSFKPDLDLYKYEVPQMSAEERSALLSRVQSHLTKMNELLSNTLFFQGPELTLADIHLFPFYRQLIKCPDLIDFRPYRRVNDWYERISSRPGTVKVFAK